MAQYLLLYEGGGGENLNDNMDAKFTTMNLSALLTSQNSIEIGRLIESVEAYAAANFPPRNDGQIRRQRRDGGDHQQ